MRPLPILAAGCISGRTSRARLGEIVDDGASGLGADDVVELLARGAPNAGEAAERRQQRAAPTRADARARRRARNADRASSAIAVERDRKAVGLVADALDQPQRRVVFGEHERLRPDRA